MFISTQALVRRHKYSDRRKIFSRSIFKLFWNTMIFMATGFWCLIGLNSWVQKVDLQSAWMGHSAVAYHACLNWSGYLKIVVSLVCSRASKCGLTLQSKAKQNKTKNPQRTKNPSNLSHIFDFLLSSWSDEFLPIVIPSHSLLAVLYGGNMFLC